MKKGKAAMANVRQIQVAKLKYYYAVPMFDFVETVNHVCTCILSTSSQLPERG